MNSVSHIVAAILKYAYTRIEAEKLLSVFRLISEAYFYQQADTQTIESLIKERFRRTPEADYYVESLPELIQLAQESTKGKIYETIHEVSEALESLPILTLYVPVKFEHEYIKKIGTWARGNINEKILLQFIVSPAYRGGSGVSWKGIMKDYSFNHFLKLESRSIQSLIQNV
ncbi:MAG: hypothetical protein NUV98_04015 [Candidatus Roizmanbacteria bacterium]|nr:hypothetical protein [Candidatus Roizmanbacteria bacterium]